MPLVHHSTIDQAFQDLSQLMSKAEEMVKLAEYFKERLHQQPGAGAPEAELDAETALDLFDLGLVTPVTKESAGRQRKVRGSVVRQQGNMASFGLLPVVFAAVIAVLVASPALIPSTGAVLVDPSNAKTRSSRLQVAGAGCA